MMKEFFSIGEVSQLFQIPAATLRYWESESLLPIRRQENGYRQYSLDDLIILSDVVYLRDLHLSIKEIKTVFQGDLSSLTQLLQHSEKQLAEEILRLQKAKARTAQRLQNIALSQQLLEQPYQTSQPPFSVMVSFSFEDQDKLGYYLEQPSAYGQLFQPPHWQAYTNCLLLSSDSPLADQDPIWFLQDEQQYLTGLLCSDANTGQTNLNHHLAQLAQQDKQVTTTVTQYLYSARQGNYYDYYQAWFAINA